MMITLKVVYDTRLNKHGVDFFTASIYYIFEKFGSNALFSNSTNVFGVWFLLLINYAFMITLYMIRNQI